MTDTFDQMLAKAQAAKNGNGGAGAASADNPLVYWGEAYKAVPPGHMQEHSPTLMKLDEATNNFDKWSDEEYSAWGQRLYKDGLISDPNDWKGMKDAWAYAVTQASDLYTNGDKKITPWKFMDTLEKNGSIGQAARKATTVTHTSTSAAVPSTSDAEAAVKTLFKEQLGHDPSQGELDRYVSIMKAGYKAHPATETSTVHTDVKGNTTTSSNSTGAFNPQGLLEDKVQGDPEWGAYQAATTYFNALQGALGAPGGS